MDLSTFHVIVGDTRKILPTLEEKSVHCCVTSPPYFGLRDYGVDGQMGLEQTPEAYVAELVAVFREVRRVLRDDGTVWLNLGDSYAHSLRQSGEEHAGKLARASKGQIKSGFAPNLTGLKEKDLIGIPWRTAFALQADGWYLRQDIIWNKPNPMPESVKDRCTKAHEYIFLLSKSGKYHCDMGAVKEPAAYPNGPNSPKSIKSPYGQGFTRSNGAPTINVGRKELRSDIESRHRASIPGGQSLEKNPSGFRNLRSVWTVTTKPYKGAHFATFPSALIEPCVLAGCPEGGVVLDPFMGSGTTGIVALKNFRKFIGVELNQQYVDELAIPRLQRAEEEAYPWL